MNELNKFIAKIKTDGIAKTNKFSINLQPPVVVSSNVDLQSMFMYCASINLPGVNFNTFPAKIHGESFEFPYEKLYSPVTMTFYVDRNMEVKKFFDEWNSNIQNIDNKEYAYYKDYTTDIQIRTQDSQNNNIYLVTLYEAYPKTLNDIQLDYSQGTNIMTLQINFAYKYFKTELQAGIGDSSKLTSAANPKLINSLLTGDIPDNYFGNFKSFQSDLNSHIETDSFNNAKQALNSVLNKAKDYIG